MNEIGKYGVYKEKLQGICDENDLTFSIQNKRYPFYMTVKPISGMDAQMSMLGSAEDGETGYISPDAVIVFAYKDGDLTYKMSETINISDTLFGKIKNLFKKLYSCWTQHYFRDHTENAQSGPAPDSKEEQVLTDGESETFVIEDAESDIDSAEMVANTDYFEDDEDPFAALMDDDNDVSGLIDSENE